MPLPEHDPLTQLLREADAAAGVPGAPADLPNRVRRLRMARAARLRRIVGAASVAMLLAAGVLFANYWGGGAMRPGDAASQPELAQSGDELDLNETNPAEPSGDDEQDFAALLAEAEALSAAADRMQTDLELRRLEEEIARTRARTAKAIVELELARAQAEDLAPSMKIVVGDYHAEIHESPELARAAYQEVLDRYPESPWAKVAHERIRGLMMN